MLSYCKAIYPEMMEKFYVHNDSTASLYTDKPASYTLMKIMENFTDDKIDQSNSKVILAINLGTLNNFLEADEENRFGKLKRYVESTGILDETILQPILYNSLIRIIFIMINRQNNTPNQIKRNPIYLG